MMSSLMNSTIDLEQIIQRKEMSNFLIFDANIYFGFYWRKEKQSSFLTQQKKSVENKFNLSKIINFQKNASILHKLNSLNLIEMNRTQEKGIYWIKYMFQEISDKITKLFNQLDQIYRFFNVSCKVTHHFSTIIRILAPIEILQRFSTSTNDYLQFRTPENLKTFLKAIDKYINTQIILENSSLSQQIQILPKLNKQTQIVKKEDSSNRNQLKKEIKVTNKCSDYYNSFVSQQSNNKSEQMELVKQKKKIRGRRPMLTQEEEKMLIRWMEEKLKIEKILSKQQIIHQALKVCKNQNFHPNDIWLRKLINKYPRLKQFVERKKKLTSIPKQSDGLIDLNKNKNTIYKNSNQFLGKIKGAQVHSFIDLNQSQSFEQIKEDRPNYYNHSSLQEQKQNDFNDKKGLDHNEEIQLSEAVHRFQHALRGHRSEFYNKESKPRNK